jgi:hypothetical protein
VPQSSSIVFRIFSPDLLSKGKAAQKRRPIPDLWGGKIFFAPYYQDTKSE